MDDRFTFDVAVCHGARDRTRSERLAARLSRDGLRVCSFTPGRNEATAAVAKQERELHGSRALVLVISRTALEAEWQALERATILFRDPTDHQRVFVPALLDPCQATIPDALQRYRFVDLSHNEEAGYTALLDACRPRAAPPSQLRRNATDRSNRQAAVTFEQEMGRHRGAIHGLAMTADGARIVSAGSDGTARVWRLEDGICCALNQSVNVVTPVQIAPDGIRAATLGTQGTLQLWALATGEVVKEVSPTHYVETITWMSDGRLVAGTLEGAVTVWDPDLRESVSVSVTPPRRVRWVGANPQNGQVHAVLEDGSLVAWDLRTNETAAAGDLGRPITCCCYRHTTHQLVLGCSDQTLALWDLATETLVATLEGHTEGIRAVSVSPDGDWAASCDRMGVRLWDLDEGVCVDQLWFGRAIDSVVFSPDGRNLLAGCDDGNIYRFRLAGSHALKALRPVAAATRYTNAKVVLVGESTIGKSCLGYRLVADEWVVEESTHGMRVWPLQLHSQGPGVIEREAWLWDLAGQPEYRLVHQLFLNETALALVLFDPSNPEDPFRGLGHWEEALRLALGRQPVMLLVATKTDRGAATVAGAKIAQYCQQHGFAAYLRSSAKTGEGRHELLRAIAEHIPWDRTPWISTPRLFKALKDAVVRMTDGDLVLLPFGALRQQLQVMLPGVAFDERELRTVVRLLDGQGLIKPLAFGDLILLRPELLNNYAAAVVRAARDHVEGIGCISEQAVLEGSFDFKDMPRLRRADEQVLLRAVVQTFLDQSLCIRQETTGGEQLVFPSQFNRELDIPEEPAELVSYRFTGHLPTVYATLVVRLRYSAEFDEPELWKNAAVFRSPAGHRLGLVMTQVGDGVGQIKLFFATEVAEDTRVTFIRYIHQHLARHAVGIQRERRYLCPECGELFDSQKAILARIERGLGFVRCMYCDSEIPLFDLIEQKFRDDRFSKRVRELDERAGIELDNESKELMLIGDMYQRCGEAGQIFRAVTGSDHGIDGEIEFRDDRGNASGKRIYVQLKSGDSYLYFRRHDGKEVFTIKKDRHIDYWTSQAYPVYLVIRTSEGRVRWMSVSDYLRARKGRVPLKKLKQVVFEGDDLSPRTILSVRDRFLGDSN